MNELEDFDQLEVEEEEPAADEMEDEEEEAPEEEEEELDVDEEKELDAGSAAAHLLAHQHHLHSHLSQPHQGHHLQLSHHLNQLSQLSQQQGQAQHQLLQHQPLLVRNLRNQPQSNGNPSSGSRSASAASSNNSLNNERTAQTGSHSPPISESLQIAQQAATAMAAAMAAQQLLASAAAICGIDLATLSSLAVLAGQQSGGPGLLGGAGPPAGLNLLGASAGTGNQHHQAPAQFTEQLVSAVAEAAFRSPNHLVPEDLTVHQHQPPPPQPQPHQHSGGSTSHNHNHHHHPQRHQSHRLQLQQQPQQTSSSQQQSLANQTNHNHSTSNTSTSNNTSGANHRHHHLLGGHHHHSSIQTQQQLLATQGFNPMAVVVGSGQQTEILTPTHLRKAKLMFFYVRYPNSSTLKECFRDVRFNKNNTAQLVKWFSNFREFYYIQMEKFARDAVADDRIQCKEDIVVNYDHELINQLNNHYNKNRHIELPEVFRQVVEETLRHFFDAIHHKRDQEQSWKKAIYKLIARLDQEVPEVFKTDAFNEHLE